MHLGQCVAEADALEASAALVVMMMVVAVIIIIIISGSHMSA